MVMKFQRLSILVVLLQLFLSFIVTNGESVKKNNFDDSRTGNNKQRLRQRRKLHYFEADATGIAGFILIDTRDNSIVSTLDNGSIININDGSGLDINELNIQADHHDGDTIGSVWFGLNDNTYPYSKENNAPYALFGDSGGTYNAGTLSIGEHRVSATPYSQPGGGGTEGTTKIVTFTISSGPTAPTTSQPTKQPTSQPTPSPNYVAPAVPEFVGNWYNGVTNYPEQVGEAMGARVGKYLIIWGGFQNGCCGTITDSTYALDMSNPSGSWVQLANYPPTLNGQGVTHAAFAVDQDRELLYSCGGYLGAHPGDEMPDCYVLDKSNGPQGTWSRLPDLPDGGRGGSGMVYIKSQNALLFAAGAIRPDDIDKNNAWKLNLDNMNAGWITKQNIPYFRNHISHVTAKDCTTGAEHHYFLGGQDGHDEYNGNTDEVYEWNENTETWETKQPMLFARGHAASSAVPYGCGFIIAMGAKNGGGQTSDVSYYDIDANSWSKLGDFPESRNTPVCETYGAFLLCITGYTNDGKVIQLTPAPPVASPTTPTPPTPFPTPSPVTDLPTPPPATPVPTASCTDCTDVATPWMSDTKGWTCQDWFDNNSYQPTQQSYCEGTYWRVDNNFCQQSCDSYGWNVGTTCCGGSGGDNPTTSPVTPSPTVSGNNGCTQCTNVATPWMSDTKGWTCQDWFDNNSDLSTQQSYCEGTYWRVDNNFCEQSCDSYGWNVGTTCCD